MSSNWHQLIESGRLKKNQLFINKLSRFVNSSDHKMNKTTNKKMHFRASQKERRNELGKTTIFCQFRDMKLIHVKIQSVK